jgi:hypothetical protein
MKIDLHALRVSQCPIAEIRAFVEKHHYSKSVAGVTPTHCFRVDSAGESVGAAVFGIPGMAETIRKYSENGKLNLVELRRFCMVDAAPRNSESKVLGVMFRNLRKQGVQRILSYSDPNEGHVGTIYRATGFVCLGQTRNITVIQYRDRRFHQRTKDDYKKWSTRGLNRFRSYQNKSQGLSEHAEELRAALATGEAVEKTERGKFIYILDLVKVSDGPKTPLRRLIPCPSDLRFSGK